MRSCAAPLVALVLTATAPSASAATSADARTVTAPVMSADARTVTAPVMSADAFAATVGVNTHMMFADTPYWDLPATIRALRWLGVRHVRDGVSAPAPPRGAWYRAEQQRRFSALGRAGIRLTLIAGGPDRDGDTLAARLGMVRRLPGVVAAEGPNEWDLKGGSDWASTLPRHQRRLHAAVRADPVLAERGVRVYGPSFGRFDNAARVGDLSDAFDVANLHAYSGARQPERADPAGTSSLATQLRAVRRGLGERPLVITETGFHTAANQRGRMPPTPADVAGVYVQRTLLEHARLGVRRTYLYELFDAFADPLRIAAEANFGLFSHRGTPKPAARALRELLRSTADPGRSPADTRPQVTVRGGGEDLRSLVLARSGERHAVVLWRAAPIWDPDRRARIAVAPAPVDVGLAQRVAVVRAQRPGARASTPSTWTDVETVRVAVGAEPVVLQLTPARRSSPAPPPIRLPFI